MKTTLKTILTAITLGGAIAATPVHAITLTNNDFLVPTNWNGIDWDSAGTAYTQGFAGTDNDPFTLTYFAWATSLKLDATTLATPQLDNNANGVADPGRTYEYTVVAVLDETTTTCTGTACSFNINGGTFFVYYDTTPDANSTSGSLGTGFSDGVILFSGTIPAQSGGTFDTAGAINAFTVQTVITFTNPAFIQPNLSGGTTSGTLQLGISNTGWVDPGGFAGTTWAGFTPPSEVQLQADGNTIVRAVPIPEPGTLMLVGLGLLGLARVRRKLV